ncbi:MAG TPA: hypothetical protein PKO09_12885 [Anaerolineae bacterium]|nr:hypothetical protein [Anaerolineae bacterium]
MTQEEMGCSEELERIFASDVPDLEKVALSFGCITAFIVKYAKAETDLARASGDREQMVKVQIKKDSIAHARAVFATCYLHVAGRRPWDEIR